MQSFRDIPTYAFRKNKAIYAFFAKDARNHTTTEPALDPSIEAGDWARRVDTDEQKWTRFDSGESIGGI